MADNVTADPGAGGATFATDDDGTAHHPYVKLEFGADNTQTKVSAADPLPVSVSGVATAAKQDTGNTSLASIDGKITAVNTGAVTVASSALPTGASTAAKQPALGTAGTASTDVISVQGIASMTALQVADNSGSLTVDAPVGTPVFVRLSDGSSAIATLPVSMATNTPLGTIAHDSADSGAPIKIGFKAESSLAGATMVADADRTDAYADIDGAQVVKMNAPWGDLIAERQSDTAGTSNAFTSFGATASARNMITQVTIHNAHATTNGFVDFRDGTAGSVFYTFPAPATGGCVVNFNPPLRQPTANTALAYDVSAAITTVYISVNGFKSRV